MERKVELVPTTSRSKVSGQLEFDSSSKQQGKLIEYIHLNPIQFIWNPLGASSEYTESDFFEAHNYFSVQHSSRYVHSVCSALFHKSHHDLGARLVAAGMASSKKSRFWPFWDASGTSAIPLVELSQVGDFLLDLWNSEDRNDPAMFYQTGHLEIIDSKVIDGFFFFKCDLPIRRSSGIKPPHLTIAFDPKSRGFYSLNAKIRFEEPEFRFRYIEFINPELPPPNLTKFFNAPSRQDCKALLVLDRHIGDNLSLFTTHIQYLSKWKNIDLTLDASMCPFFKNIPHDVIKRFFPTEAKVNIVDSFPAHRSEYDLVFDPYDWVSEVFDLKPQNDSGATTIISAIEFAQCCKRKHRRDILEIHMSALKRLGVVCSDEPIPEFVRYQINTRERVSIREKTRARLLKSSRSESNAKIVTLFPFGLTADRRYSSGALQAVLHGLLKDANVYVVVAGTDFDTTEMVQAMRSDWPGISQPCQHRIKAYFNEPLADLLDLMLASDVVVSMDSGPLHLARALRINPIALYTGKVNKPDRLLSFPWLVEDDTAEVLKPNIGDEHVLPGQLLQAIFKRLNFLPLRQTI